MNPGTEITEKDSFPSLLRFLASTGIQLRSPELGGVIAFGINGFIHTAIGLTTLFFSHEPQMSMIFLPLGLAFLGVSGFFYRKMKLKEPSQTEELTGDALKLMKAAFAVSSSRHWQRNFGGNSLGSVLGEDGAELLELACEAYNRLQGSLQISWTKSNSTLDAFRPTIRDAAWDAMAAIWNDVAVLKRLPEGGTTIQQQIRVNISAINELGNRVDEMLKQQSQSAEVLKPISSIESVLERLRLDQDARKELESADDPEHEQLRSTD